MAPLTFPHSPGKKSLVCENEISEGLIQSHAFTFLGCWNKSEPVVAHPLILPSFSFFQMTEKIY